MTSQLICKSEQMSSKNQKSGVYQSIKGTGLIEKSDFAQ